jgi:hypothetical protein
MPEILGSAVSRFGTFESRPRRHLVPERLEILGVPDGAAPGVVSANARDAHGWKVD